MNLILCLSNYLLYMYVLSSIDVHHEKATLMSGSPVGSIGEKACTPPALTCVLNCPSVTGGTLDLVIVDTTPWSHGRSFILIQCEWPSFFPVRNAWIDMSPVSMRLSISEPQKPSPESSRDHIACRVWTTIFLMPVSIRP